MLVAVSLFGVGRPFCKSTQPEMLQQPPTEQHTKASGFWLLDLVNSSPAERETARGLGAEMGRGCFLSATQDCSCYTDLGISQIKPCVGPWQGLGHQVRLQVGLVELLAPTVTLAAADVAGLQDRCQEGED